MNVKTVSINFTNDNGELDREIIPCGINSVEIIGKCINAAMNNQPIYSITEGRNGYQIQRRLPSKNTHEYVKNHQKGEISWHRDFLYAKDFSLKTAQKIVSELYNTKGE